MGDLITMPDSARQKALEIYARCAAVAEALQASNMWNPAVFMQLCYDACGDEGTRTADCLITNYEQQQQADLFQQHLDDMLIARLQELMMVANRIGPGAVEALKQIVAEIQVNQQAPGAGKNE